jgi:hypothetical protein
MLTRRVECHSLLNHDPSVRPSWVTEVRSILLLNLVGNCPD